MDRLVTDDLLLLAGDVRAKRLRFAFRAASHAQDKRMTVRRTRRSLVARGLLTRTGRRRYVPARTAHLEALQRHLAHILFRPREATERDRDLVVVLLAAGALSGRQRMLARTLLASARTPSPAVVWLLVECAAATPAELADKLLRATAPQQTFPDGAFDPGVSSGVMML